MIAEPFVAPSGISVCGRQGGNKYLPDSAQEPGIPNDCHLGNPGATHLYEDQSIIRK